jgi:hypothetical protein
MRSFDQEGVGRALTSISEDMFDLGGQVPMERHQHLLGLGKDGILSQTAFCWLKSVLIDVHASYGDILFVE